MTTLPKMRTARGALAELRKLDPDTEVSEHMIRQIIHEEKIPVVPVGTKKLIDVDALIRYLASSASPA